MNEQFIKLILLVSLLLVVVAVVVVWRQKRLIRQIRQLAKESEDSKLQIIAEQRRNQQIKQEMTSNIAHELKTPVSSIRGYLEILLSDKPIEESKRRFFLERSYQQTLRLSELLNDVSLINKLEEASQLFPKENIELHSIAHEAINELEGKAQSKSITIQDQLPDGMRVTGNHNLIYGIFRNLIENSISYAGEGVTITVRCYKETPEAYFLHFYDTGCGVKAEYVDRIFDRFLRIDEGRSRKLGGSGLGLSIVKHAVQFHGGQIYAKNREQGGLEFYFSISKQ